MRTVTTRASLVLAGFVALASGDLPASADTLLHYDFSNGSGDTVADLSGKGNDGNLVDFQDLSAGAGQFAVAEGWVVGGGLSFLDDDIRSFIETPLELSQLGDPGGGTLSHTIEFLASYATSEGWTPAIGSDHRPSFSGSEAFFFGIDNSTTQVHVRTPSGDAGNVGPHPWLADGGSSVSRTEHHLAYVYDFDRDEIETFVDGVSAGVAAPGLALNMSLADSDIVFRLGNVGWNAAEQWGGVLKGVAISGSALAPGDFALTGGNHPTTVLNYDFADGSGESVTDVSGNGNDGLLVDFVDTSAGAGAFDSSEGWVSGGGLSFLDDDQRSYVETPLEVNTLEESFTIEFITNYAAPQGWSPVVGSSQDPFDGSNAVFAGVSNDGTQLHFRGPGWAGNIGDQPWLPGVGGDDEQLHHVAMRYDEDTGEIEAFVDGEPLGVITLANTDYGNSTSLFRIANVGWSEVEQWAGVLHGVAISDQYLDPDQFVLATIGLAGDYNRDGVVDAADVDLQSAAMKDPNPDLATFDENGDAVVNVADRLIWIKEHAGSWAGDSNLDKEFNSADLVKVFADGLYESGEMAGWSGGDWDGDMLFSSSDLVFAFADGGYELGPPTPAVAAVPEPCCATLALLSLMGLLGIARRTSSE